MPERFVIPTPTPGPYVLGPDSQRQPGVPQGVVTKHEWRSEVFPGTVRDYWVYVPAQSTPDKPSALMVFQDGGGYVSETGDTRAPIVFDNLIHQGKMPVTIGLFINPGVFPPTAEGKEPVSNRLPEYMPLTDQYARLIIDELMPEVGRRYRISDDPDRRAVCGISAGGICSWSVVWQRTDAFRKVISHVGSFGYVQNWRAHDYPYMIRKSPRRPIRAFLQASCNDLDLDWGDSSVINLEMASALNFAGYDFRFEYGDGGHSPEQGGALLPESLIWLWR